MMSKSEYPIYNTCLICGQKFEAWTKQSKNCDDCMTRKRKLRSNKRYLKMRFRVFVRDNFTCQYCGRNVKKDKIEIVVDHIIPLNKGGTNICTNLTTACEECNSGKGDALLNQREAELAPLKSRNKP